MDVRLALAVALLCSTLLAGCVEKPQAIPLSAVDAEPDPDPLDAQPVDEAPQDDDVDADDGDAPVPAATEEDVPPVPVPPVPSLNVSADGAYAPLRVNVTVDATDGDGDLASWTLAVGNRTVDGTAFPSVVSHTFEQPGTYNVTLRVVDAANHTADVARQVVVVENPFPHTETLNNALLCGGCSETGLSDFCVGLAAGANEQDCVFFVLPEGAAGRAFTVSSTIGDPDLEFRTTCAYDSGYGPAHGSAGAEEGTIPEGMGCIVAWEWEDFDSDITLSIE